MLFEGEVAESGLKHAIRDRETANNRPGVQIPPSPPKIDSDFTGVSVM
jgi:hypothetical protein